MKKKIYIIGIALLAAWTLPAFSQVSNDNEDGVNKIDTRFASQDFVPGQVLVKFKDDNRIQIRRAQGQFASTNVGKVTEVMQRYGVSEMEQLLPNEKPNRQLRRAKAYNGDVIQEHDLSQLYCVTLSAEHLHETMKVVEELKELDEVEFAEPNYRVYMMADTHIVDDYSGNPMEGQQWYLDAYGVKELWNKPIINKERPVIAILDTGVDLTHPDLKDNLWTNTIEEYGTKDNDNDGNGFKNDVHGWDFVNNSPNIRDNNMHGTHVAGIAAAANNGIGIVGANPQAYIMPITVLQSDGAGDIATIIKGIDYATANGATVINMSLGLYNNSNALRLSLENAYSKAILVAAAGNEKFSICVLHRKSAKDFFGTCFPAAYSFVLGVQATNIFNELTDWSNYDNDGIFYSCETSVSDPDGFNYELKAPGRNILSTIPGGNYKQLSGTSMAAPLVAGSISALMMVKQYSTQEILWGDLLHTDNIVGAYNLTSRPAELDMQKVELRERKELSNMTEEDYGGDNEVDAGETVSIYPVIRTTFGEANNIKLKLTVDEFEDPDIVEIVSGDVDFGIHLDAYGKAVSLNPLVLKIPRTIAEGRHIRLKVVATCDEIIEDVEFPLTLVAHNMIKISGLLTENTMLTSDHVYYVNGNLGIDKGVTLTIEPGTRLEFAEGTQLMSFGKLNANGTKEAPIVFAKHAGEGVWDGIFTHQNDDVHNYNSEWICCNRDTTLFTLIPTEATPVQLRKFERRVYYGDDDEVPNRYFTLSDYLDEIYIDQLNMTGREWLLTDINYITPAVLRMRKDFNDYCDQYPSSSSEGKYNSRLVTATFLEWCLIGNPRDTISYCRIEDCAGSFGYAPYMKDCVLKRFGTTYSVSGAGERNVVTDSKVDFYITAVGENFNYVNNIVEFDYAYAGDGTYTKYSNMVSYNYMNNFTTDKDGKTYSILFKSTSPKVDHSAHPSYLGTAREDLIRPYIYELGNGTGTWGTVDLSNMPAQPYKEAHGIVWKVLVNGKDAQDEFEDLPPLGVGKHKFEVYFNRPMNKAITPQISFGVRDPFTQQSVAEDGSWNEEGTIYTAYKTITGKTMSDGLNRIYVRGAEDNEFFECPYEKTRFNIIVQVAGSMSTGFTVDAGLGCVKLSWNDAENDFEDAMGINVYRYSERFVPAAWRDGSWHEAEMVNDTIQLNQTILDLETTSFTDYDVEPGKTYYYYYEFLSSDLKVCGTSNTVAATPLTSTRGDANGSGTVDVADVITTVNYITKQNPQPFIFEAADMNTDNVIDILDVMGIVKGILNPNLLASAQAEGSAAYTIEDGILFVESELPLGGVQVQLTLDGRRNIEVAEDLNGLEQASAWLSDNDYLFLAYSMNGKTLAPGKHALLHIGDADITSLRLSDTSGKNVNVNLGGGTTGIDRMGKHVMNVEGVYDLQGRKLSTQNFELSTLKKGIYIINGKKVVK